MGRVASIIAGWPSRAPRLTRSTGIWASAALAMLLLAGGIYHTHASGPYATFAGTIKDPQGNPLNGKLVLVLSQPGQLSDNTLVGAGTTTYPIVNGQPPSYASVARNDQIQPSGTYYVASYYDSASRPFAQFNFVIAAASYNFGQAIPTSVTTDAVSYVNPIDPSQDITFTGNVTFQGPATVMFTGPVGGAGQQQVAVSAGFITTAVTNENAPIAGINLSAKCVFAPLDSVAAAAMTASWVSGVNAGATVTFNHPATAGMHFNFVCTPY